MAAVDRSSAISAMLYAILFLVRYFPFWAVPLALVFFELGSYHYNRRERSAFIGFYCLSGLMVIASVSWVIFEGYWRAGPIVKRFLESF